MAPTARSAAAFSAPQSERLTGYGIIGIGVVLLVVLHWVDKLFSIF